MGDLKRLYVSVYVRVCGSCNNMVGDSSHELDCAHFRTFFRGDFFLIVFDRICSCLRSEIFALCRDRYQPHAFQVSDEVRFEI